MPAEPPDHPSVDPDPLGLDRPPAPLGPADRVLGLLTDLGLTSRTAAVGFGVCLVAALGWWWLRSPAPPPAEAGVPLAPAVTATSTLPGSAAVAVDDGGTVFAHAAGAVRRPGLYELVTGDRVADLLAAAGGALPAADLDRINLAAPLTDGVQVVVPRRGDPAPAAPAGSAPTGASPSTAETPAVVDINQAGIAELETLPGVGPVTAAAIIEHRDAHGPFATVESLIDVSGIGEATLAAVIDLVTV